MTRSIKTGAVALAAILAAVSPMAVFAQETTDPVETPDAPAAPMAQQDVTDTELDAFALAYEGVIAVDAEFAPQLAAAVDDTERAALEQQAQARKSEIVTETDGIDVNRYVEILTLAQVDPALTAQIVERLDQ